MLLVSFVPSQVRVFEVPDLSNFNIAFDGFDIWNVFVFVVTPDE